MTISTRELAKGLTEIMVNGHYNPISNTIMLLTTDGPDGPDSSLMFEWFERSQEIYRSTSRYMDMHFPPFMDVIPYNLVKVNDQVVAWTLSVRHPVNLLLVGPNLLAAISQVNEKHVSNASLIDQIESLLHLNESGSVSHPIPGMAVELLTKAATALRTTEKKDDTKVVQD